MMTSTQNHSIFFVRHGKLALKYKNHNEMPFDVMADLASGKLNPPIDEAITGRLIMELSKCVALKDLNMIYTSPSKRCQSTASLICRFIHQKFRKKIKIQITPELSEVDFDLRKIYFKKERNNLDIEKINDRVFTAMTRGDGAEPVSYSYKRIKNFFTMMYDQNKNIKGSSLVITHDFLMRVIEVYIKNRGKTDLILNCEDLKNTKRNLYLDGFSTDSLFTTFLPF